MALESLELGSDESRVLAVLEEIGPACDRRILEALNQKEAAAMKPRSERRHWTINAVTGRRNGLVEKELIDDLGTFKKEGHRAVHLWRAKGDSREPVGWKRIEIFIRQADMPARKEAHEKAENMKAEAALPVLNRLLGKNETGYLFG
jgi:hypothetical protein